MIWLKVINWIAAAIGSQHDKGGDPPLISAMTGGVIPVRRKEKMEIFKRYILNDNDNNFVESFDNLTDAFKALKQQGGGNLDKLNCVTQKDILDSVDYEDIFNTSRLSAAWNRINFEGSENNGSGRSIFCLQCVSTESIAEMLDANGDWGDLDEYIEELANRAGVDIADYEFKDGSGYDDSGYFTAIQNSLGVNLGY